MRLRPPAAQAVAALGLAVVLAGCSSPSDEARPRSAPSATSSPSTGDIEPSAPSPGGIDSTQTFPGEAPASEADGDEARITAGSISFAKPDGWVGGTLDPEGIERAVAEVDAEVMKEAVRTQLETVAAAGNLAAVLDLREVERGEAGDIATAGVLPLPQGMVAGDAVDALVEVFREKGATNIATGSAPTPLGTAPTITFDATEEGIATRTQMYFLPVGSGAVALVTAWTPGRDNADVEALVSSLRTG